MPFRGTSAARFEVAARPLLLLALACSGCGLFGKGGEIKLDLADEIIDGALLTHEGQVRHAPTQQALEGAKS